MRPEGTPLDLNNLPEEYGGDRYREGKEVSEESSTTATAEPTDAKRETETLNRARQLVFNNENLGGQGPLLGCNIPSIPTVNFNQRGAMGDPSLPFRPVYTRLPSPSSPSMLSQPPLQPYLYTSSSPRLLSFPSPYPPNPMNDYYIGHVLNPHHPTNPSYTRESNYTCIGAPVTTHGFPAEGIRPPPPMDGLRCNQGDGLNWNCGNADGPELDVSPMDRFRSEY
ncbi:zinc finger protein STAMENLESS 1-like isoform X2 [Magnolia sinica]|uniref:zinc finger protein STAMENLESS 1-like isoform X2 n=1 Tax=Magnolia sinica TaxID=86752 RepID=UPI00265AE283|nr:zinc finger protein STAMENLESS 1-like isoform X2 [Magnolia sinica]